MRLTAVLLTLTAALATATAASARTLHYQGKTSSGHKITFTVKHGRMYELRAGIRMSCVAIQGWGPPTGGSEMFGFRGSIPLRAHSRYTFEGKPAFFWNDVTMNNDLWLKRRGRAITGRMRLQYGFLVPKYPPGTFVTYSCLGGATFKAVARRG
jgi:hypothetical protein